MSSLIASDKHYLIVGCGKTGLSVARFLRRVSIKYSVFDTRNDLSLFQSFLDLDAETRCFSGVLRSKDLANVTRVIISPGVSINHVEIQKIISRNIEITSDVGLFLEQVACSVIGITGSNGKSTVTTLVGLVAQASGLNAAVGGNIGTPALDLLDEQVDMYVLEISSFQLEAIANACFTVACNLNISPDHLDRHLSFAKYVMTKQKIFYGAKAVVYKLDDTLTQPPILENTPRFGFSLTKPAEEHEQQFYLNMNRTELVTDKNSLLPVNQIKMVGLHNLENALAVYAICEAAGIDNAFVGKVLGQYRGLAHRCEFIDELNKAVFINDSKATNTGAAIAAIKGLSGTVRNIFLIAGGVSKDADFTDFADVIVEHICVVILIGHNVETMFDAIDKARQKKLSSNQLHDVIYARGMKEAVYTAYQLATDKRYAADNDRSKPLSNLVLLSPACASFDMYKDFEARGDAFKDAVRDLVA